MRFRSIALMTALACGGEPTTQVPVTEQEPVEQTSDAPPNFPEWAEVRLDATGEVVPDTPYVAEWTLLWPEATDDVGLEAYLVLLNGEEVARIEPTSVGYDLGEVPEENRSYTIVAVDSAGQEASLDFALPATLDARMEVTRRSIAGPPGSLRTAGNTKQLDLRTVFDSPEQINDPLLEPSGRAAGIGEPGTEIGAIGAPGAPGQPVINPVERRRIRGRVHVGAMVSVSGQGTFDTNLVTRMIRRRSRSLRRCYEYHLRTNPTVAGNVTISFTVTQRGTVSGAQAIGNTTGEAQVAACFVQVFRRLRFNPGPEGGDLTYQYPFVLAPHGETAMVHPG